MLYKRKKICGILQEVISFNQLNYLIVGIGINTNTAPQNKSFSSACLKNIVNKKIDNKKIIEIIRKKYEKFLKETKRFNFAQLKKRYG